MTAASPKTEGETPSAAVCKKKKNQKKGIVSRNGVGGKKKQELKIGVQRQKRTLHE